MPIPSVEGFPGEVIWSTGITVPSGIVRVGEPQIDLREDEQFVPEDVAAVRLDVEAARGYTGVDADRVLARQTAAHEARAG